MYGMNGRTIVTCLFRTRLYPPTQDASVNEGFRWGFLTNVIILVVTVATRRGYIVPSSMRAFFCVRLCNYAPKGEWQKDLK